MIRIVTDDKIPFLKGAMEGVASVKYLPGAQISNSDLKDADVLITRTRTECNEELLMGTNVSFIASATIGIDHIDAEYCRSEGINWANAPGCNSSSVQQYVISTLLFLANHRNLDLHDLTLGVVGVGNVGSKVAMAAENLGMKVLLNDPPREQQEGGGDFVALETVLKNSDIITMHVPLTGEGAFSTYEMVNRDFFKSTKKGVSLINTSRGPVVNERVLLEQIQEGNLSDVVLDVFQNEPAINLELLNSITIGTPHIAGYSQDGKANGTTMSVRAISRFFNLGLDDWEPEYIPIPPGNELYADASQGTTQELIWDIFQQTYDVSLDHQRLMKDPGTFEKLRGDYPLRREPLAYSVRLFQGYSEITTQLEKIGFSVLSDHCA